MLDGLDFLMWHMKFNLHDGDAVAFSYTLQLLGFSIQYRIKSGVLILFTGVQGTGKTVTFGQNESGPGVYMRIYGDCGMVYNNIEALLKDFNTDAMGKLYCLLEEANPGNNTRNNNQLKDVITGGRQRIDRKGVDAFHVDDCRSFVSCSQDVPFKIEQGDRRFVVNRSDFGLPLLSSVSRFIKLEVVAIAFAIRFARSRCSVVSGSPAAVRISALSTARLKTARS